MYTDAQITTMAAAYEKGNTTARAIKVDDVFLGAMEAATCDGFAMIAGDEFARVCRSLYMHGYLDGLRGRSICTNEERVVTSLA